MQRDPWPSEREEPGTWGFSPGLQAPIAQNLVCFGFASKDVPHAAWLYQNWERLAFGSGSKSQATDRAFLNGGLGWCPVGSLACLSIRVLPTSMLFWRGGCGVASIMRKAGRRRGWQGAKSEPLSGAAMWAGPCKQKRRTPHHCKNYGKALWHVSKARKPRPLRWQR